MPTKAYVITLKSDFASAEPTKKCLQSIRETDSKLAVEEFRATEPHTLRRDLELLIEDSGGLVRGMPAWNWPLKGVTWDPETQLRKHAYVARDTRKVIACAVSHLRLWVKCIQLGEPLIILEHDSIFTRKFDPTEWKVKDSIVGLNNPKGATRKASVFYSRILNSVKSSKGDTFVPVPDVDAPNVTYQPCGLSGNSAYYLTPEAAKKLVSLVNKYGIWPNDAIMCKQLLPNTLYVVYPFYTKVQGIRSTTTQ